MRDVTAVSVSVVVHGLHAAIVVLGAVVVAALLAPGAWTSRRRVASLRRAVRTGTLVTRAERVAARRLAPATVRSAATVAAVATLGAAAVHVAVAPEHFEEGARFGVFFTVLAAAQCAWSVAVVRWPRRSVAIVGALGGAGVVALWVVTRTVGLPLGIADVEAPGVPDVAATLLEVAAVAACWTMIGVSVAKKGSPECGGRSVWSPTVSSRSPTSVSP